MQPLRVTQIAAQPNGLKDLIARLKLVLASRRHTTSPPPSRERFWA